MLTKMFAEDISYSQALLLAQQLGFAESDPLMDVEGFDVAHKCKRGQKNKHKFIL